MPHIADPFAFGLVIALMAEIACLGSRNVLDVDGGSRYCAAVVAMSSCAIGASASMLNGLCSTVTGRR